MFGEHGLTYILLGFVAFSGALLLVNALIDLGLGKFRHWLTTGLRWLTQTVSRGPGKLHDRVIALRPR